jgi:hypothetical protein
MSCVNGRRTTAHTVATTGLRRNFKRWKPSMGASFQAPPTGREPTADATDDDQSPAGISGRCSCRPGPVTHTSARPAAMASPTPYRAARFSTVRPPTARRIGMA